MEIIIAVAAMAISSISLLLVGKKPPPQPQPQIDLSKIDALSSVITIQGQEMKSLKKAMSELPRKTLRTFEGSSNVARGEIAEWCALQKLSSAYDIVIPFNSVFDFMCIRFPKDEDPGTVDFVDVKSGKASLSAEQRKLRDLIKDKKIDFLTVKVQVK